MTTSSPPQSSRRAVQDDHVCSQCGAHPDGNWYERYGLVLDLVQVLPLTVQALALLLPHTSAVWPMSVLLLVIATWVASRAARPRRCFRAPAGTPAPDSPINQAAEREAAVDTQAQSHTEVEHT